MKEFILSMLAVVFALISNAQTALKEVYNEDINSMEQIDQALVKAKPRIFENKKESKSFWF